jgi:predicted amidophosphoribosyltransferase
MKPKSGGLEEESDKELRSVQQEARTCPVCGTKFSAAGDSDFCPVCLLRGATGEARSSIELKEARRRLPLIPMILPLRVSLCYSFGSL